MLWFSPAFQSILGVGWYPHMVEHSILWLPKLSPMPVESSFLIMTRQTLPSLQFQKHQSYYPFLVGHKIDFHHIHKWSWFQLPKSLKYRVQTVVQSACYMQGLRIKPPGPYPRSLPVGEKFHGRWSSAMDIFFILYHHYPSKFLF